MPDGASRCQLPDCLRLHAGIAYDSETERIFVTGKYWPRLFEIKLKLLMRRVSAQRLENVRQQCMM